MMEICGSWGKTWTRSPSTVGGAVTGGKVSVVKIGLISSVVNCANVGCGVGGSDSLIAVSVANAALARSTTALRKMKHLWRGAGWMGAR